MRKKPDNTWRMCVNYIKLNAVTIKDRHPLPDVELLWPQLRGKTMFSKIDMVQAYQIKLKEDRWLTAFTTPTGLYEFVRLPFGLCNASINYSLFFLIYGRDPIIPINISLENNLKPRVMVIDESIGERIRRVVMRSLDTNQAKAKEEEYNKFLPNWIGPFKVLEILSEQTIKIAIPLEMALNNLQSIKNSSNFQANSQDINQDENLYNKESELDQIEDRINRTLNKINIAVIKLN
ncbi:hypothetical protein ACTFIV_000697 [Dictyostelium citrinum]